ncbi:MAG: M20/M25/M40 family metallo-hydrolase [Calditrichaceae bacterium]|nr:M20/M25/M40 family metallo-hydrolase [Calditrichaceae bacterium]
MFKNISFFVLLAFCFLQAADKYIQHDLKVSLYPDKNSIEVTDRITFPDAERNKEFIFIIHQGLKIEAVTNGLKAEKIASGLAAKDMGMDREDAERVLELLVDKYKIVFSEDKEPLSQLEIKYSGIIHHPVRQSSQEYARGFSESAGIIDTQGVYLAGSSYWIPYFNEELITFNMEVTVPQGWSAVSQGKRTKHDKSDSLSFVRWESPEPMEEVFLIAGPFFEFASSAGAVNVMAFLRSDDPDLANKYLETTAQYLEMYRQLIGPFPFSKFALVENFWETGYGMPSFTLLGPQVIRFPFILHSSYPHELLHNWWGNSVFVNFSGGNWCEGITVYLADHLIKEQRGQGAEYRRSALQRFTDYVNKTNDFPLTHFNSRYDAASEAVGYGKGMMLWEMLRNKIGDEAFKKTMRSFYRGYKFKRVSFDDIRLEAEKASGVSLNTFFDQWLARTGAPELELKDAQVKRNDKNHELRITINQIQQEDVFNINIPIRITCKHKETAHSVFMEKREQTFVIPMENEPLKVSIDPGFNLFRKLNYNEIPPALSMLFGAKKVLIILPSAMEPFEAEGYKTLAEKWASDKSRDIRIIKDSAIETFPADRAVWIFGANNRFIRVISEGLKTQNAELGRDEIRLENMVLNRKHNSFIIAVRHPENVKMAAALLTIHDEAAVDGLARKLPHYGKYSYLAFEGEEPVNVAKGQWTAAGSLLVRLLSDNPVGADFKPLPERQALAGLAPVFSEQRMMDHVRFLADSSLEGRGVGTKGAEKAAEYIAGYFKKTGLQPIEENNGYFQIWEDVIDGQGNKGELKNVIGIIPGKKEIYAEQSVVVCAHYDHLGKGWPDVRKGNEGKIHPGADDNASGVAVMLELAELLSGDVRPDRTIVFIAFTAEESGLRGSKRYLQYTKEFPKEKIMGAINLDTVGRLFNKKALALNTDSAREWKFIFMGASYVTGVETEMVTQELDASDQTSFIKAGIPAVQIFSGPHADYHRPSDTIDKIDPSGLVKIAALTREAVIHLAERENPLTFEGGGITAGHPDMKTDNGSRKVSTGIMPDFAYSGEGVRIQSIASGSPAEKAGLRAGDVIIKVNSEIVGNLKAYADQLKKYKPGDEIEIGYLRENMEYQTKLVLQER